MLMRLLWWTATLNCRLEQHCGQGQGTQLLRCGKLLQLLGSDEARPRKTFPQVPRGRLVGQQLHEARHDLRSDRWTNTSSPSPACPAPPHPPETDRCLSTWNACSREASSAMPGSRLPQLLSNGLVLFHYVSSSHPEGSHCPGALFTITLETHSFVLWGPKPMCDDFSTNHIKKKWERPFWRSDEDQFAPIKRPTGISCSRALCDHRVTATGDITEEGSAGPKLDTQSPLCIVLGIRPLTSHTVDRPRQV